MFRRKKSKSNEDPKQKQKSTSLPKQPSREKKGKKSQNQSKSTIAPPPRNDKKAFKNVAIVHRADTEPPGGEASRTRSSSADRKKKAKKEKIKPAAMHHKKQSREKVKRTSKSRSEPEKAKTDAPKQKPGTQKPSLAAAAAAEAAKPTAAAAPPAVAPAAGPATTTPPQKGATEPTSPAVKDNVQSQLQVHVQAVEMPDRMRAHAVGQSRQLALRNRRKASWTIKKAETSQGINEQSMAAELRATMESTFGGTWHVLVGRHVGGAVTHEADRYIFLHVDSFAVLVFKAA